ncbi:hypothetical protein BDQ12DRAFT_666618 [Crucibulum laeve]|uniref:Uncharacterized protein n=1 Tax=Crucibulum laeve TaxID=68775 RepID=A0A5C3LZ99_9AGAR|nr:hypothetical protein BDQ12DRAFT_666618 [Crucibulum laeve]
MTVRKPLRSIPLDAHNSCPELRFKRSLRPQLNVYKAHTCSISPSQINSNAQPRYSPRTELTFLIESGLPLAWRPPLLTATYASVASSGSPYRCHARTPLNADYYDKLGSGRLDGYRFQRAPFDVAIQGYAVASTMLYAIVVHWCDWYFSRASLKWGWVSETSNKGDGTALSCRLKVIALGASSHMGAYYSRGAGAVGRVWPLVGSPFPFRRVYALCQWLLRNGELVKMVGFCSAIGFVRIPWRGLRDGHTRRVEDG